MCELRLGVNYFYDDSNDGYDELRDAINERFNRIIQGGGTIFTTNTGELFDTFLNRLPEKARQFYNCNSCKHFFNRYGGLVTISNGEIQSVLWDESITPKFFLPAIRAMKSMVLKARVNGIFLSEERNLGYPVTGEYTHFYAQQPKGKIFRDRLKTAGQAMAEKKEEYKMLMNALQLFSSDVAEQALALIKTETLYRGDKCLGITEWFVSLHKAIKGVSNSRTKENLVWLAVATAPNGFCHVRSSMIGTLLEDINDGLSVNSITTRFNEKMNPANYMRSQSAPSSNAIYEAEKTVAKLGIASSLQRRYATIDEIPTFLWKNNYAPKKVEKQSTGVFGGITPKDKNVQTTPSINLPTSVMTWEKFQRTVLPTVDSMEVMVDNPNRLMALVTASDEFAENIMQWDNPFSWYYHGGIDGEVKRRVEEAGGRYENNEIRCSLIWEGYTDLDLHCITPRGGHICYSNKRSHCGGWLDLDMNGLDRRSNKPVENLRWSANAPEGRYQFYVHNFRENGYGGTPFKVELEINGKVYHYEGTALRNKQKVTVFEFNYSRGQQPAIRGNSTVVMDDSWGVPANSFVKVNGITTSPNLWGSEQILHTGSHVFFLLDGCKDLSEGKGRGFFNEMLKSDLRQIRKVLEAYTGSTPIEGVDDATASGVGYSKDSEWNLLVKVTSDNSTRLIKIDRWD